MSHELVCVSGVELLNDYLEDALSEDLRADIESHVSSCERCTAFVASYRATPRIVREATHFAMPPDLEKSLMEFLKTRRR